MRWFDLSQNSIAFDEPIGGAGFLYFVGGYLSIPDGCTDWGTSVRRYNRFIGDVMGEIVIGYTDGTADTIPLVYGYTLWFQSIWREDCAPFKSPYADPGLTKALKEALYLYGAFEANDVGVLSVKSDKSNIKGVQIRSNPDKEGYPVFNGVYYVGADEHKDERLILSGGTVEMKADLGFFETHTVDCSAPYPDSVKERIAKINYETLTFEDDYGMAPDFVPADGKELNLRFSGNRIAEIANGVVYHNARCLAKRVDEEGFIHTSYKNAPTWQYNGFGPWIVNAGSYHNDYYSRDAGRALMTLVGMGEQEAAERGVRFGNKWMMYFPENKLKIKNTEIPGHYTVVVNKPLLYSTVLTNIGWPTQYTEEAFGEGYRNLGNQETDGHGLMMMANYLVWNNAADKKRWASDNWDFLNEGAEWIVWCFENPDISFAREGLLYAESEAGMKDYTLYCNMACYLGLSSYVRIAKYIGNHTAAQRWMNSAEALKKAITNRLSSNGKWDRKHTGFFHDPVIPFCSDIFGYDRKDMPEEWVNFSENTYEDDISSYRDVPFDASGGVGYNTSMLTQNALLHDRMKDADAFVTRLTKIAYSPRLPEPYMVPEGASYAADIQALRRQGDLGNLVQQAEALKCYAVVCGISPVIDRTLKIMPRLPLGWNLSVKEYKLVNAGGFVSLDVSYPKDKEQAIRLALIHPAGIDTVYFRFGPFEEAEGLTFWFNGSKVEGRTFLSGDSYWAEALLSLPLDI